MLVIKQGCGSTRTTRWFVSLHWLYHKFTPAQVIYYPSEKLKQVKQIVLQHHDQKEKSLPDYVINVLPTTTTTTTTTTATTTTSRVVLETIRSILETVDEATSLELILSKIVAAIAKFYKKEPASLFASGCPENDTACVEPLEDEKPAIGLTNLIDDLAEPLKIKQDSEASNLEKDSEASNLEQDRVEFEAGASSLAGRWEPR